VARHYKNKRRKVDHGGEYEKAQEYEHERVEGELLSWRHNIERESNLILVVSDFGIFNKAGDKRTSPGMMWTAWIE
jgi:hypothetical protein